MKRLWKTMATAVAVASLVAGALATPALADPKTPSPSTAQPREPVPRGFADWTEVYAFQNRLNAAAERILAADKEGNASVVAGPENRELRIYWKGEVPASVREVARTLDVPVAFLPARFTHTELVTQAQRLAESGRVIEAAPQADGSGVEVVVSDQMRQNDRAGLQASTTVALSMKSGRAPQAGFNRQADVPNFWGGSLFSTANVSCSNGFALRVSGATSNVFMITAGHCGNDGDAVQIPGQPTPTGTTLAKTACRDIMAINYPAGVLPAVYTGGVTSSTSANVVGATSDFVGNLVVTSGASSGEHLNIPVKAVDVFTGVVGLPCTTVGPLTRAAYSNATCAMAPGDSGGPVYSYFNGSNVLARGTMTGAHFDTAVCPVPTTPGGANEVYYAPLVRPAGDPQIGTLAFTGFGILTCTTCGTVTVPNLKSQTPSQAGQTLSSVGLNLGSVSGATDNSCNNIGTVMSQSPGAGSLVSQGSAVNITVGDRPPPPFECP